MLITGINPRVEFEQTAYTVLEDEVLLQVCAVVSEKPVSEQIHLTLYTEDDTAQGIFIKVLSTLTY